VVWLVSCVCARRGFFFACIWVSKGAHKFSDGDTGCRELSVWTLDGRPSSRIAPARVPTAVASAGTDFRFVAFPAKMAAIGAFAGVGATAVCLGAGRSSTGSAKVVPSCLQARAGLRLQGLKKSSCVVSRRGGSTPLRGVTIVARVASTIPPDGGSNDGDTRVATSVGGVIDAAKDRISKNFRMLPLALISILVGFSMCAFFPHPESPGDATICFTIIFLSEFLSSVLYAAKRPRGLLKWLRRGKVVPLMLNCFKIGVLYGLFCDAFKVGS
jgi:hypothetical protein